ACASRPARDVEIARLPAVIDATVTWTKLGRLVVPQELGFWKPLRVGGELLVMARWKANPLAPYLLSLPERGLPSATALAAGLLREIGEVVIPRTVRGSHLYQNLVEVTLRFLIEQVGQVESIYPISEKLTEDFLVRRTAGNGIELIGILAFRASPVWVLAALADASGAGRYLIREIANCLKDEGLLDRERDFNSVDQMLDGLEASAARLASTINMPPLDVPALRQEWESVRRDLSKIPPKSLPSLSSIRTV